ncbi:MAG TPA: hypothetical protein PKE64_27790 [Anaerolineae bacterium]|nr:hypothetical protein [Anaerolineae bacterium]HMR67830.1 hypothetical protein [Anaerolineae bacterium]
MAYTITPAPDGRYIVITVTGTINRQTAMQYNLEAHALGQQLGIDCFLVDVTEARNTDTVIDTYDFAYHDMSEAPALMFEARVAVLVSPGDHSHDFVEVVARNAGLNMTLFTDRDQAVQHLLRDAPASPPAGEAGSHQPGAD